MQFPLSDSLREQFAGASETIRAIQIIIENEMFQPLANLSMTEDISLDCEQLQELAKSRMDGEKQRPSYFVFQNSKDQWALISFISDSCPVKERTLYGSSSEHLKRGLGVKLSTHCTELNDLSWPSLSSVFQQKIISPLATSSEANDSAAKTSVDKNAMVSVHAISMAWTPNAEAAIAEFINGAVAAVVLRMEKETIEIDAKIHKIESIEDFASQLCKNEPRFAVINYEHEWKEVPTKSQVFIYVCPEGCKVNHRMIYSSSKTSVINAAEALGLNFAKKLEFGDISDITTKYVHESVHPAEAIAEEKKFSKPSRPGGGKARLL